MLDIAAQEPGWQNWPNFAEWLDSNSTRGVWGLSLETEFWWEFCQVTWDRILLRWEYCQVACERILVRILPNDLREDFGENCWNLWRKWLQGEKREFFESSWHEREEWRDISRGGERYGKSKRMNLKFGLPSVYNRQQGVCKNVDNMPSVCSQSTSVEVK